MLAFFRRIFQASRTIWSTICQPNWQYIDSAFTMLTILLRQHEHDNLPSAIQLITVSTHISISSFHDFYPHLIVGMPSHFISNVLFRFKSSEFPMHYHWHTLPLCNYNTCWFLRMISTCAFCLNCHFLFPKLNIIIMTIKLYPVRKSY